jgi:hypothetical protein
MNRLGIKTGPPQREASTLEKSHSNSLFNCYSEPLKFLIFYLLRNIFNLRTVLVVTSHPFLLMAASLDTKSCGLIDTTASNVIS